MKITKERLKQIIKEELDRDLAKEGFEELGMFNAKLVNQGHNELADELGQIVVKLQRAGLTSQDFLSQGAEGDLTEKFENDQQLRDSKEDVLRQIVAQGQRAKVQGDMVDLFSAGAIVTVLDALSPENKNKFLDFPPYKMAEIAFKLLK